MSGVLGRRGHADADGPDHDSGSIGPLATLAQAGIDPAHVAHSLMEHLQRQDTGDNALDPRLLLQLDWLGRSGLDANQLQSVLSAMTHLQAAPPNAPPATLNGDGLNRIIEMARAGATAVQLQSQAAQLLAPMITQ